MVRLSQVTASKSVLIVVFTVTELIASPSTNR